MEQAIVHDSDQLWRPPFPAAYSSLDVYLRAKDGSRPHHNIRMPDPATGLVSQPERTLLAMCAYEEARGEPDAGMRMVSMVVRNRTYRAPRYGVGWRGVLLMPKQFSCFNAGDPNTPAVFELVRKLREYRQAKGPAAALTTELAIFMDAWERACCYAYDAAEGRIVDLTDGATHYCRADSHPPWRSSPRMTLRVSCGHHLFFHEEV